MCKAPDFGWLLFFTPSLFSQADNHRVYAHYDWEYIHSVTNLRTEVEIVCAVEFGEVHTYEVATIVDYGAAT